MKKSFSDFFPLPKFLAMRPFGLSLSERSVHVVEFVKNPNGLALGKFCMKPIPPGVIKEGYINDKKTLVEILKSIQKEFSIEFVSASLPEEKAFFFKIELPKDEVTDLRQAVEFRLEENAPISASEATFDFVVIPDDKKSDKIVVAVAVFPTKVVETYLDLLKEAGFKVKSLNVEASAVSRAVVPKNNNDTFMVVDVRDTATSLSIVSNSVVRFNLTIPVGGEAINDAIAQKFSVSLEEAVKIKNEKGFTKNKENLDKFVSVMDSVSSVRDEMNKLMIYWETHSSSSDHDKGKIEKVILCGRDTGLVGFDDYLSSAIRIPVELANVWQNAFSYDVYTPAIPFLDSLDYAGAIGLALPQQK